MLPSSTRIQILKSSQLKKLDIAREGPLLLHTFRNPGPPLSDRLPSLKVQLLFPMHARKSTCCRDGQTCSTFQLALLCRSTERAFTSPSTASTARPSPTERELQ